MANSRREPVPPSMWLRQAAMTRSSTTEWEVAILMVGSVTREAAIGPTLAGGRALPEVAYAWEA